VVADYISVDRESHRWSWISLAFGMEKTRTSDRPGVEDEANLPLELEVI
jgi:hypothetical protein